MRKSFKGLLTAGAVASMALGAAAATPAHAADSLSTQQVTGAQSQAALAAKGDVGASDYDCGWNQDWMGQAYYNHCGSGSVRIQVNGTVSETRCVGENITYLGSYPRVTSAWYIGAC